LLLRTLQNVAVAGNSCFMRRADTPLRLLTSSDRRSFGGYMISKDVVRFAVELLPPHLEVGADRPKDFLQTL
jgi:hypothetical protein